MNKYSSTTFSSSRTSSDRRGNTLILVTAILVLLVIIATAYITRAQGVRNIAAAQRNAVGREDRAASAANVIAGDIAANLFPKLINGNLDPGADLSSPDAITPFIATTATPRSKADQGFNVQGGTHPVERYGIDPYWDGPDTPVYPYNFAPYETRAWTNWPDAVGSDSGLGSIAYLPGGRGNPGGSAVSVDQSPLGDDNPLGNPGFGDFRLLRSSEPRRAYDGNGQLSGYTHWPHLSFPATAENGWRLCFDISNIAPFDPDESDFDNPLANPTAGFTLDYTAAEAFRNGDASGYFSINEPVALQTPYEQWVPGILPNANAVQNTNAFLLARNAWFSRPQDHFQSALTPGQALPNFISLNDLGPVRTEFTDGTRRNVVGRTFADSDGDGFTDSFWFVLPGTSEDGIRQIAAVSVVDNAAMVDVNVATRFDRQSTAGTSPSDVALTSRPVLNPLFENDGQSFDLSDTWTGLFSDPQNVWPAEDWGFSVGYDDGYVGKTWDGGEQLFNLRTAYDVLNFGDDPSANPSWLRSVGVLNRAEGATGIPALELPYRSALTAFSGGVLPWIGDFDRRRYFRSRQSDGNVFVNRRFADDDGVTPIDYFKGHVPRNSDGTVRREDEWGSVAPASRGFGKNDEIELRMFAGSNYSPVISNLERTVNRPWARNYNLFRSSMTRDENYQNGDKLDSLQLLRDTRHRATTYSATRNDLRPLWLRPTAIYNTNYDYSSGRIAFSDFDWGSQDASDLAMLSKAHRAVYDKSTQKLDLRSPLDGPLDRHESWLYYAPGGSKLFRSGGVAANIPGWDFFLNFDISADSPEELIGSYWNSQDGGLGQRIALDRGLRFRTELQRTLSQAMGGLLRDFNTNTVYAQSWLGNSFDTLQANQASWAKTELLNASWAANIDTFRDNRPRDVFTRNYAGATGMTDVQSATVQLDQPIYPDWAPRLSQGQDQDLPAQLRNLTFIGNEKQPFIMESFFALVYPKSKITPTTLNRLEDNEWYPEDDIPSGDDLFKIPPRFSGYTQNFVDKTSEPAIVFAIQIANPYDSPVGLHDIRIKVGDNRTPINLAGLPCPHPAAIRAVQGGDRNQPYFYPEELYLGPTKPDAPRTAIVFGIIPPGGYSPDAVGEEQFEEKFDISYADFHRQWVDFLDLEPGNLFGYDAGLGMSQLQTLVFDASPRTFHRETPDGPANPPEGYRQLNPLPLLSKDPKDWFDDPNQSVELWRIMQDPRSTNPSNSRVCVVDRLDNQMTGEKIEFRNQLKELLERDNTPYMDQAFTFEQQDLNFPGRAPWNGIRIGSDDFLVSWVRAGRAWGWDRNRNGVYDMNETSPRYIFSEIPEDDWQTDREYSYRDDASPTIGPGGAGGGTAPGSTGGGRLRMKADTFKLEDDPDGDESGSGYPWLTRNYILPLATKQTGGGGTGYAYEFESVRAKPVRFSTATALQPGVGTRKVDYDAGYPVLANGAVRMTGTAGETEWPGKPAANFQWVLMDKGQKPEETIGGNRNGGASGANYSRLWLEKDRWAYPLQMLQKDDDFEQVGEIANTFLWGHAIQHRTGITTPQNIDGIPVLRTVATFGEIMNGVQPYVDGPGQDEDDIDMFPVSRNNLTSLGPPTFDQSQVHTNRWYPDPGNLSGIAAGATPYNFRPFTQSLGVTAFRQPWAPALPAGTGIFDALVCDGPGANTIVDVTGDVDGGAGLADGFASAVERLAIEDARYDLAGGFSGRPTRGLININTASPEVIRTLPHMSRLVYNNAPGWQGTYSFSSDDPLWNSFANASTILGDVESNGTPRGDASVNRNPQWVRVPEAIERYRDGTSFDQRIEQMNQVVSNGDVGTGAVGLPHYADRGSLNVDNLGFDLGRWLLDDAGNPPYYDLENGNVAGDAPASPAVRSGLFPGMRRTQGFSSVGELALLGRTGYDRNNFNPAADSGQNLGWAGTVSSIRGAGLDPYGLQNFSSGNAPIADPSNPDNNVLLGLGWRPFIDGGGFASGTTGQADARLATDRQHVSFLQNKLDASSLVEIPDNVAMDAEESNLLFAGISNLVSTRSDTFTVYLKIRSFKQNSVTGVWSAMDPEFIVDDSRYIFSVDRSRCEKPSDEPEIRFMTQVPN